MKYLKRVIFIILYLIFAYFYALNPKISFGGGTFLEFNKFSLETFIMVLFIGAYLVAFWKGINKLFRN